MKPVYLIFITILFCSSFVCDTKQNDWTLIRDESGIKVYTKKGTTSVKSLKLVTTVKAKLSSIVYLLLDKPNYPTWVYRCINSYEITKVTDYEYYHYQETSVPWPAENRDVILWFRMSQHPTTKVLTITISAKPDYLPRKSGKVRITQMDAKWILTPLANGDCVIEYYLSIDPGGSVPGWIVNMGITDGPIETMKNMNKQLVLDKYKNVKLSFIRD